MRPGLATGPPGSFQTLDGRRFGAIKLVEDKRVGHQAHNSGRVPRPFSMAIHTLIRATGPLWDEATRSPFLDALAAGNLPADALHRWLAQDYLFAKDHKTISRRSA